MKRIHLGNAAESYYEEISTLRAHFNEAEIGFSFNAPFFILEDEDTELSKVFSDEQVEAIDEAQKRRTGWSLTHGFAPPTLADALDPLNLSKMNEAIQ